MLKALNQKSWTCLLNLRYLFFRRGEKKMNKKGFTLIEVIVVLIIIAIMAGLLAPNIGAWLPNYRLRSATRDIVSTMRDAQLKAISHNGRQYQVNFTVGTNSYILQYSTGGLIFPDGPVQTTPSDITIDTTGLPGKIVTFNSDSTCTPAPAGITLQNTKKVQRLITISSSTGKVTIQ
jgi:prepilin-type N-terminal cleavage/methylation domain-containing protein